MELSKYIETIKSALAEKLSSGIATVDAVMSSEGTLHGGSVAVDGKPFQLGNFFPTTGLAAEGVKVRFNISVAG